MENNIVEKYKMEKFITNLMDGKLLTDDYISHCSKSIFNFIANSNKLKIIFKDMLLNAVCANNKEEYYIMWKNKRLNFADLRYSLINSI